jgi:D-glycero-D-manno-heptose 1,7-bisphosphate phosphatase
MVKSIFLDRDGVIIEDTHHLYRTEDIKIIEGATDAIRRLNEADYKVIIITNQAVVARGICDEQRVREINKYITALFYKDGSRIDGIYYCPHHPTAGNDPRYTRECGCRKPKIGLILKAKRKFNICLKDSYVIGDKTSDIKMGDNAGCKTVLVQTGHGGMDKEFSVKPNFVAKNILEAVYMLT